MSIRTLSSVSLLAVLAGSTFAAVSYNSPVTYPTPSRPDGIASGDFDNDGDIDLAIATDTPDKVSILFNTGNGAFAAPVNILTGSGTGPNFVRAVDIDGDTDLDLAVTLHNTNQIMILRNNGAGGFTPAGTFAVGVNPRWIAAVRADNNASMDLVVSNRNSNSITVLLNTGNTTFSSATYPVGAGPRSVTTADLNRDGRFELIVANHDSRNFTILANNGQGVYTTSATISVGSELRPEGVVAADLDRDGDADLVLSTSGNTQNFASVFINTAGTLSGPVNYPVLGINPGHVGAIDLDRDSYPEIVTANEDSANISILRNLGNGTFASATLLPVGATPHAMTIADFNRDQIPDIAITAETSNNTTVLLSAGTPPPPSCYANCDGSTVAPVVSVLDLQCFVNRYLSGDAWANCDGSTVAPVLSANDLICYINRYITGCP